MKHQDNPTPEVKEHCKCLVLDDTQMRDIMEKLELDFKKGLDTVTAPTASVKMHPTYIRAIAVGAEQGEFLALDLGGTYFRVMHITLLGDSQCKKDSETYTMPDHIQKGSGTALFDHIASCLATFMKQKNLTNRPKLPLGFTFSFPCQQNGLTNAVLTKWTKGFNASGVVGANVVQLLREACVRRGDVDIDVVAVLNDTTGTMLACSFIEKHCYIGLIVGTGCNAAYMEKLENVPKLREVVDPEEDGLPAEMCMNTEWGAFGDDGALDEFLTIYDQQLDDFSLNPNHQRFEKTISGMYLGEIVRLVLEDLTHRGLLFNGDFTKIAQRECFPTTLLSKIEGVMQSDDDGNPFFKIGEMLREIGITNTTTADGANVAYVCSLVSNRAAHFCACGVAALLRRMQRTFVTVGVDGSVFRSHPTFKVMLDHKVKELVGDKYKFTMVLSEDGSGRGAAVAAAVASRMIRIANERRG